MHADMHNLVSIDFLKMYNDAIRGIILKVRIGSLKGTCWRRSHAMGHYGIGEGGGGYLGSGVGVGVEESW